MIGQAFDIYRQLDASKKTPKWADESISKLRMYARPLVNVARMRENKALLLSEHSMESIKNTFKDKKFLQCTEFVPLGLLESIRTSLTEELAKYPPKAELRATDPTAMSEKEADIQLLKNRKIVEQDISKYNRQVGLPAHKVQYDQFKGNVEQFDKMGLDENDPDDISFFEQNIQRLDFEIAGQSILNSVFKLARFDQDLLARFVLDILSGRTVCVQVYVDQTTGEIKLNYVFPETAYGIFGDANDGRDDICRGWQDTKTVLEWLQEVGNDFDFNTNWGELLWAINYCMGTKFTGFIRNNSTFDIIGSGREIEFGFLDVTGKPIESQLLDWTIAWTYKIYVGYIEWNTVEATNNFVFNRVDSGYANVVSYATELTEKEKIKGYYKESRYQQQWYRSYYIATTSISQWIYGYQKVYHQLTEGANDEYAVGTCLFYRQEGKAAVELVKEFVRMVELAWYKIKWCVFKAKPEDEAYLYNEIIEIAKAMQNEYPQTNTSKGPSLLDRITKIIEWERENHIKIRFFPQVEGRTVPQVPQMPERKNGIDVVAFSMQAIFEWAESHIGKTIGWNPIRSGGNPQSRESYKSANAAVEASQGTTGYFYRMAQFTKERVATTILLYIQDIIKFKDTLPYKWIKQQMGQEKFKDLRALNNVAAHRYSLWVRDYNADLEKQKIDQAAGMALQQKEMDFDQWFVITQTEDPKAAAKIFSHEQRRKRKKERKQAIADQQRMHDFKMQEIQAETQLENLKGQWALKVKQEEVKGFIESAKMQADSRVKVKEIQVENEPNKAAAKTQSAKEIAEKKKELDEQKPYPGI